MEMTENAQPIFELIIDEGIRLSANQGIAPREYINTTLPKRLRLMSREEVEGLATIGIIMAMANVVQSLADNNQIKTSAT